MKIYLAGPWAQREFMPTIAAKIEAVGGVITHKWWDVENTLEGTLEADGILRYQAECDYNGVVASQLVVVINSAKSEGKSLEQGVAVAHGKPIIMVGKRGEHSQNVFHYMTNYRWLPTVDAAIEAIVTISWLLKREQPTEDKDAV